jgi:hypothetical protein
VFFVLLVPFAIAVIVAVVFVVLGRGKKEMLGVESERTETGHKHRQKHHGAQHRRDKNR